MKHDWTSWEEREIKDVEQYLIKQAHCRRCGLKIRSIRVEKENGSWWLLRNDATLRGRMIKYSANCSEILMLRVLG